MIEPFAKDIPDEHLNSYPAGFLLGLYERMFLVREFEEQVKYLFLAGSMPGTIHQCQGQEATAVGVCSALAPSDWITSTHRPHGHALAKGVTPLEILKELFGKGAGCCKGKGGSMHIGNMQVGMPPAIAIVAGGIPVATGMALAIQMQHKDQVVACFFGDGATSEGAFHEAVAMGAVWNLPVIYVCENNQYGASTHTSKISRLKNMAGRASAYGITARTVDGNDVTAVYAATLQAAEDCRGGQGPVFLELMTYRLTGHSRRDPCNYQPKEEREYWTQRDPILMLGRALVRRQIFTEQDLEQVRAKVSRRLAEDIESARQEPEPELSELTTDVYA